MRELRREWGHAAAHLSLLLAATASASDVRVTDVAGGWPAAAVDAVVARDGTIVVAEVVGGVHVSVDGSGNIVEVRATVDGTTFHPSHRFHGGRTPEALWLGGDALLVCWSELQSRRVLCTRSDDGGASFPAAREVAVAAEVVQGLALGRVGDRLLLAAGLETRDGVLGRMSSRGRGFRPGL